MGAERDGCFHQVMGLWARKKSQGPTAWPRSEPGREGEGRFFFNPGVNIGDIGVREKPMKTVEPYVRLAFLGAIVLAILACMSGAGGGRSTALGAPDGIPDQGLLEIQTNQKLDEVNANLRELNGKMESLLGLLKSGKLVVMTAEGAATPAGGKKGEGGR